MSNDNFIHAGWANTQTGRLVERALETQDRLAAHPRDQETVLHALTDLAEVVADLTYHVNYLTQTGEQLALRVQELRRRETT